MATEAHAGLLGDPHVWVLISTVIFAFIAFKKAKAPLLKMLDNRTDRIARELDEAARLHAEAQDLLAEYQRKHRDAIQTAQKIIDQAREAASRIETDAKEKLEQSLKRKENQVLNRIAMAEAGAMKEIRDQAADLAIAALHQVFEDSLKTGNKDLTDQAISSVRARLN